MGKLAFMFPGQAAQYPGMGKELAEKFPTAAAVFAEADRALGESLSEICFAGSEEALKKTVNTQPAILTVSAAIVTVDGATPARTVNDAVFGVSEFPAVSTEWNANV